MSFIEDGRVDISYHKSIPRQTVDFDTKTFLTFSPYVF